MENERGPALRARRATPAAARRWRAAAGGAALSAVALLLNGSVASAQAVQFPSLVSASTEARVLCASAGALPGPPASAPATAQARDSAASLGEAAAVATLAGEPERARDQLRRAAILDPTSSEVAFRLGRVAEDLGDAELATTAYCRLRATARDSAQLADANERVEALAVDRGLLPPEPALGRFQRGLSDAAGGALPAAERAFDEAIARAPAFAIAYYDRALVRIARGRAREAADDLRRFETLNPRAVGRELAQVRTQLERGTRSPAAALGWGLVPGGSQIYSGRPWLGAVVAAAAVAGVVLATQKETRMEERSFLDPFGRPYTDLVPVTVHPRRTLGIAVAGGATLAGAVEGSLHVSADRAAVSRLMARVRAALREQPVGRADDARP